MSGSVFAAFSRNTCSCCSWRSPFRSRSTASIEAWFGYRDQRARLDQLLGVQATSAAAEIHDFIHGIANQLGWLVQLPWSDEPDERRRTDALRLFRQAPAIVSLTLLDNSGLERLYVSRIGLNRIESRTDRSADPAVIGARSTRSGSAT